MPMPVDFGNTVKEKPKESQKIEYLTIKRESDSYNIFNLLFGEKKQDKSGQK